MAKGKAINWKDSDLDKLSEVTTADLSKAQGWASEDLQNLLAAEAEDDTLPVE
jgi:hypothetical protein